MPTRKTDRGEGARPTRRVDPVALADWSARTFASEAALVQPPPGEISLNDEVADDLFADRDNTRLHLANLRNDGLL